jgi:hypothetical protein
VIQKVKECLDVINCHLIEDIPQEIRKTNANYRDLIYLVGELNARISK